MKLLSSYQVRLDLVLRSQVSNLRQSPRTKAALAKITLTKFCRHKRYTKTSNFGSVMFLQHQQLHSTLQTLQRTWISAFRFRKHVILASVQLERRFTLNALMKSYVKSHWTVLSVATYLLESGTKSAWLKLPTKGFMIALLRTAWKKRWCLSRPRLKCNKKFLNWVKKTLSSRPNAWRWKSTSSVSSARKSRNASNWIKPTNKKRRTLEWQWPNLKLIWTRLYHWKLTFE